MCRQTLEASPEALRNGVDMKLLFHRVQTLCGVRFVSAAMDIALSGLPLSPAYIRINGIVPVVRRLNFSLFEEGYALLEAVLTHEAANPLVAVLRAQAKFRAAVATSPCDHNTLNMWGLSYRLLADHVTPEAEDACRARAVQLYVAALCLSSEFPEALTNLGNVLCDRRQVAAGCACFMAALLVAPQYNSALNALAYQVSADQSVSGGVPQMKRLLMEVAGRTAVLKVRAKGLDVVCLVCLPNDLSCVCVCAWYLPGRVVLLYCSATHPGAWSFPGCQRHGQVHPMLASSHRRRACESRVLLSPRVCGAAHRGRCPHGQSRLPPSPVLPGARPQAVRCCVAGTPVQVGVRGVAGTVR